MKRLLSVIFLFILSLSLSCSPNAHISEETRTPTSIVLPSPTVEPSSTITASPTLTSTDDPMVKIYLVNDTDRSVCGVYAYSFNQTGEVENLIENADLSAGNQIQVEIEKGEYIFEIWDCDMNSLFNLHGFQVIDDLDWHLSEIPDAYTFESQQTITLVNQQVLDVCEFFIRSNGSIEWGENLFDRENQDYLPAGSILIEPIIPGHYDLMLIYCDGSVASIKEDFEISLDQNFEWILVP